MYAGGLQGTGDTSYHGRGFYQSTNRIHFGDIVVLVVNESCNTTALPVQSLASYKEFFERAPDAYNLFNWFRAFEPPPSKPHRRWNPPQIQGIWRARTAVNARQRAAQKRRRFTQKLRGAKQ